uniref:HMA domain-containing protein n=1 Tax=Oryza brachyantha TaxID=4533 RepID=J3LYR1_ORYBR
MRKEIVIRLQKGHNKAIKVAAAVSGVESVTLAGEDKNLLLVIGSGVDSTHLTEKLRRKVGHAEVVELRTVDADELLHMAAAAEQYSSRYSPGAPPYNSHAAAGRDPYYAGAGGYPHQRGAAGARDHYYGGDTPRAGAGAGSYGGAPMTMATGGYYAGAGYPQYGHSSYYPPAAATSTNTHTVVHHQYSNDPDSCSIM